MASTSEVPRQRPRVLHGLGRLRAAVRAYRENGERIALVPTMGALHEGHLSLVSLARRRAARVIVSIFVNPTQFSPSEDLSTYPRALVADVAALSRLNTDLVWAPSVALMYPEGFTSQVTIAGPASVGLEDGFRPHFFPAVATVVTKLFLQCLPDFAVFGEKDYQQLRVVMRMVKDLDIPVQVLAGPTVREADGLAMSSRNVRLSADERRTAPVLYRVLCGCAVSIAAGEAIPEAVAAGRDTIERAGFVIDYLEARDANTLGPIVAGGAARLLAAARLGTNRLIDNIPLQVPASTQPPPGSRQ